LSSNIEDRRLWRGVWTTCERRVLTYATKRWAAVLLCLVSAACAPPVDVIPFTSETFPPKASGEQVAVLDQKPTRPHIEIAELDVHSDMVGFERLQRAILERAAKLGADAVVFFAEDTYVSSKAGKRQGNGPGGASNQYGQHSSSTIRALKGLAIRYTEAGGP
jgi:hypothetical protein